MSYIALLIREYYPFSFLIYYYNLLVMKCYTNWHHNVNVVNAGASKLDNSSAEAYCACGRW